MLYAFALHVILVVVVVPRGTYHNFFTPIFPHSYEMSSLLLSDVIKTLGVGETREKSSLLLFWFTQDKLDPCLLAVCACMSVHML